MKIQLKYKLFIYTMMSFTLFLLASCSDESGSETGDKDYIYDGCIPIRIESFDSFRGLINWEKVFEYKSGRLHKIHFDGHANSVDEFIYSGNQLVRINHMPEEMVIQSYYSFDYNQFNQVVTSSTFFVDQYANTEILVWQMNYNYSGDRIVSANMFLNDENFTVDYQYAGNQLESVEVYGADGVIERKLEFEWDGMSNEFKNLRIPMTDYSWFPYPFQENPLKIFSSTYDMDGNLLSSGEHRRDNIRYNDFDYTSNYDAVSIGNVSVEYVNCGI